jgi:glycosyltransferase involved in cell wall biosynthesis
MPKVTHIVSGDVWGGAESQALMLLQSLQKLDCEPSILLFNSGTLLERVKKSQIPHKLVDESSKLRFFPDSFQALKALSPDIIVTHGYKECFLGNLYCRRRSVPHIDMHHGVSENRTGIQKIKSGIYQSLRKYLTQYNAAKVIAVSKNLAAELGIDSWKNLEIIYNAAGFPEKSSSCELSLKQPALILVGRLTKVKRVDLALHAFHQYINDIAPQENSYLYVVGEGPERANLERLSKELQLSERVEFLGFREDAPQLIQAARVLLLSSDSEGLPTVLLEAMQSRIPVVSTAVGGIPEVLAEFPSYPAHLVEAGDADAFALAIAEKLKQDLSEAQLLDEGFEEKFKGFFHPHAVTARHLELYQSIMELN